MDPFPIDETIAFLTSDKATDTPFAKRFCIDLAAPFHLKNLRTCLRERNVVRVTIKRRGSAVDPTVLQCQLNLNGDEHCVLFLTRAAGKPYMLVGQAD